MNEPVLDHDVVVVGAGFAGLYALYSLRGKGLRTHVFERGSDVGGTWFWNRYPGARCDIESLYYNYTFSAELDAEWVWQERYPAQPEILRYLQHAAERLDLRRNISLGVSVESAHFDESADLWRVRTDDGREVTAGYVITAVGCLSAAQTPDFTGLNDFAGRVLHTGQWPADGVDVSGLRVGVIGTGSSGIQVIPMLAEQAAKLLVLQRTPNFTLPARNRPLEPDEHRTARAKMPDLREQRRHSPFGTLWDAGDTALLDTDPEVVQAELERRWALGGASIMMAYTDVGVNEKANEVVADFVRARIAELVDDPETARLLTPTGYPIGAKRLPIDTNYFATFNRANVDLVDLNNRPFDRFTPDGVVVGGVEHPLDVVVLATGFDAITGSLERMDIRGAGGLALKEKWSAGPRTYLGLATAGFPNLFMITGPGSPSVLSNVVTSIEQHVEWIADCIEHLRAVGVRRFAPTPAAEDEWVAHVNVAAEQTLLPRAASWYLGANVPGKPRIFMPYVGGVGAYRAICDDVAAAGYRGFDAQGGPDNAS